MWGWRPIGLLLAAGINGCAFDVPRAEVLPQQGSDGGYQQTDATGPERDSGTSDAGIPADSGTPPPGCELIPSRVRVLDGLRELLPGEVEALRPQHATDNGLVLYAAAEHPTDTTLSGTAFDIWVFYRAVPIGPYTLARPTNLEDRDQNKTSELDLKFVPGLGRFWLTVQDNGRSRIRSAELRDGRNLEDFWTFLDESSSLPGADAEAMHRSPTLNAAGTLLVVAEPAGENDWDLIAYVRATTEESWRRSSSLAAVNSAGEDTDAWLSANGNLILFASNRWGDHDLYCASRSSGAGEWSEAYRLGELSTIGADERAPWLDARGVLFSRTIDDIEQVHSASLR